jgi:hypothetical protein
MKVSSLEFTMGTCNDVGNRVQLSRQAVFAANIYQWLYAIVDYIKKWLQKQQGFTV